ncbi:MAG: cell wall metabolism sensor histidine kinase WalK [Chloroflexota bacterium]|nr:cell wall metabolism sensor histidine kinase WalK [Chloroflexota bacterium]
MGTTMAARRAWRFTTRFAVVVMLALLVLVGLPLAVGLRGAVPLVSLLAVLFVASAVFVLAVAVYIDRRIISPVVRLTRAARRLTAGNLDQVIPIQGLPEVTDLADAFNDMAVQLREEMDALAAERNRVAVVLASMADGIVIVDRLMRVQRVNKAAGRLLNIDEEGALGQTLAAVVRDHELCGVLQTALSEGVTRTAVARVAPAANARLGTGWDEPRHVRATGLPIPGGEHDADPAGLLVLQDVTELRRSEVIRREFVGNVSHELRTPLASLKALVETLEEGALDDPPAAREFLGQMHVEVDSLAQLVQELLDLSRIESGQAILRPEAVPAAGLVEEAEARLRMQAERIGVDVRVEALEALPMVWADPARVVQVLINLLHNAIKFTPAGGRVTLRAAPDADGIRFTVIDSGIGIAPGDLPRIFERFYKVDKSRASGGTGLGLAIAKHIIQAHGGRIWAESSGDGSGATFSFTLPLTPAGPPPPPSGGEAAAADGVKVTLVEA